jgi:hypothetical protein
MCTLGYRPVLEKTLRSINRLFKKDRHVTEAWNAFGDLMPPSDSARDYVESHPEAFFVPFEAMFKTLGLRLQGLLGVRGGVIPPPVVPFENLRFPAVRNSDSVKRRDNRKPDPPRVLIETGADATVRLR